MQFHKLSFQSTFSPFSNNEKCVLLLLTKSKINLIKRKKMKIFTQAFKHLTHNLPQATAFLASRHCIFSSSVIPEFLSEDSHESRHLLLYNREDYMNILRIFILSDTMQFSSTMMIPNSDDSNFTEEILLPLLRTKNIFHLPSENVFLSFATSKITHPSRRHFHFLQKRSKLLQILNSVVSASPPFHSMLHFFFKHSKSFPVSKPSLYSVLVKVRRSPIEKSKRTSQLLPSQKLFANWF